MRKDEIVQEIKDLNKRERYLAGHVVKRLPVHQGGLINKGERKIDLPIVYLNYKYSTDINTLTSRTKLNVLCLREKYDIDWFFIVKYKVEKEHEGQAQRHAWMIYGLWNGALVNLYRKETKSVCAGQTNLFFGNGHRTQVYKLRDLNWPEGNYSNEDFQAWLDSIKRLNKVVNHHALQRIILMYA